MRLSSAIIVLLTFLIAACLSLVAARFTVTAVEHASESNLRRALDDARLAWAEVEADGLRVILAGTAPDEAARFQALSTAGREVDATRIVDAIGVAPPEAFQAPRFSAEILRNDSGISIIGLIPAGTDRTDLVDDLRDIAGDLPVADLLEVADYPVPKGWEDAMGFAVEVLSLLPRSKVSVDSRRIAITAIADSAEKKRALEAELARGAPPGLRLRIDIAAPRPVITPFTLRFVMDEQSVRFDACSADSRETRNRIVNAAFEAGLSGNARCTIGMGVPSPRWGEAVETAIAALAELGGGSVTFSNADVTLIAAEDTDEALFDRVVGELETALPEVFALHAVLPEPETEAPAGPVEFVATLSPEGLLQMRGRLTDESLRQVTDSYARARFGSDRVYTAARIVPDLPADWPVRVLAGLEALSMLSNGAVVVTPDNLTVSGVSIFEDAKAEISRFLADELGEAEKFTLDISYRPPPPPADAPPDPEICEQQLLAAQDAGKINFEPGSATITAESLDTMDRIAEILDECGDIRLEIQGHTDSQGREVMNQQLSQARAQSVLNELRARRVLTSSYTAVGYGETRPIADNDTEEGREENRRIEFRLIRPEPLADAETTLDAVADGDLAEPANGDETGQDADPDEAGQDEEAPQGENDAAEEGNGEGDGQ